jgi:protein-L-isoaspartate O-methyltransferase
MPTFDAIKQAYDTLRVELLKKQQLMKQTKHGLFGVSSYGDVQSLFQQLKLEKTKRFVDLGSGDGRVVLIASLFFEDCVGIEGDEALVKEANKIKEKLQANVTFIAEDYLEHDLSVYDVLFINPDGLLYALEKKLKKEMKKDTLLIVYHPLYKPLHMELLQDLVFEGLHVHVYKV